MVYMLYVKLALIELALLNLQLALMTEHELVDVDDYETWLCGV